MPDGTPAYQWRKDGNDPNYMWETTEENPEDRPPLEVYQLPDDNQYYHKETFAKDFDDSVFDKPAACNNAKACDANSHCQKVQNAFSNFMK